MYFFNSSAIFFLKDKATENCEQANPLGHVNNTQITEEDLKTFEEWNKYDASQDNFVDSIDGKILRVKLKIFSAKQN
jgi:hypothetical protein